jgi:carbon storage regulator
VLILTRKAEQGIVIDRVTTVRILSIDGDRVKIGIDAPMSIPVLREELLEQVAGQNREAAQPPAGRDAVEQLRALRRQDRRARGAEHNGGPTGAPQEPAESPSPDPSP